MYAEDRKNIYETNSGTATRSLIRRIAWKYRRTVPRLLFRRIVSINLAVPIISFSFDDAPRTAFAFGGDILKAHGSRGTYFVSLGMLGSESPSGTIASQDDLRVAVEEGHELGCHTFDHRNPWETTTRDFEQSIVQNRHALAEILPETAFACFAYPLCGPNLTNKRLAGRLFRCCRGGGQAFNVGKADLNQLRAFFLHARNHDSIKTVQELINRNCECRGWLIFATHDVGCDPSPYGCTQDFFEKVVAYSAESGAHLMTIGKACQEIQSL